ncbi:hypothetical protein MHBO_000056 [Bonamia ostreae]
MLSLLEDSRLSTKTAEGDFGELKDATLVNGTVRSQISEFLEYVQRSVNEPPTEIATNIALEKLNTKTANLANHLKLLSSCTKNKLVLQNAFADEELPAGSAEATGSFLEELERSLRLLSAEALVAMERIAGEEKDKRERVERAQRRKEEIALKRGNGSGGEKEDRKAAEKRKKKLAKKSDVGLGKANRLFYDKFKHLSNAKTPNRSAALAAMRAFREEKNFVSRLLRNATKTQKLQTPRGTRDTDPRMAAVRDEAFAKIKAVFDRYGAVQIDTPVFEKKEVLLNKYGEDSKLIYDLKEQGGEPLSLRYDLTVPFARYAAMRGLKEMKRYHIGKVYRRDAPAVSRGKFREFYQCDFDIAGKFGRMLPDAEILAVCSDILTSLELGEFVIRVNHRVLLDAILESSGVPASKFRTICSAIDKLDKCSWAAVKQEMVFEKGLSDAVAEEIKGHIFLKGRDCSDLLAQLRARLREKRATSEALEEMETLLGYLDRYGCAKNVSLDFSLARGLDYYTGLIFEAVLKSVENSPSIAGGGRYDHLIGMFSGHDLPAIGLSIGIERILAILGGESNAMGSLRAVRESKTEVLVASAVKEMALEKISVCTMLRKERISSEYVLRDELTPQQQINIALDKGFPFVVFIDRKFSEGMVQLKNMKTKSKEHLKIADVVSVVRASRI